MFLNKVSKAWSNSTAVAMQETFGILRRMTDRKRSEFVHLAIWEWLDECPSCLDVGCWIGEEDCESTRKQVLWGIWCCAFMHQSCCGAGNRLLYGVVGEWLPAFDHDELVNSNPIEEIKPSSNISKKALTLNHAVLISRKKKGQSMRENQPCGSHLYIPAQIS